MSIPIRWQIQKKGCDAYAVKEQTSSALHGHYHFLLTLIIRGEGVQTLNGTDIEFSPGYMFLLSPADFHKNTLRDSESYDYYGVKFNYELLDKRLAELCSIDKFPISLKLSDASFKIAVDIFERLIEESELGEGRIGNRLYLQSMVEQLVIIALRELDAKNSSAGSAFLNKALGYLYTHFFENITVNDAAQFMGYTPNYFNTIFRKSIGMPFGIYLRDMRLKYAANLLKSSELSITEIAMESGFESSAHFSRSFREKYGMPPKDYRKQKD